MHSHRRVAPVWVALVEAYYRPLSTLPSRPHSPLLTHCLVQSTSSPPLPPPPTSPLLFLHTHSSLVLVTTRQVGEAGVASVTCTAAVQHAFRSLISWDVSRAIGNYYGSVEGVTLTVEMSCSVSSSMVKDRMLQTFQLNLAYSWYDIWH